MAYLLYTCHLRERRRAIIKHKLIIKRTADNSDATSQDPGPKTQEEEEEVVRDVMLIEADISRGRVAKLQARAGEALSFLAPLYLNLRSHTLSPRTCLGLLLFSSTSRLTLLV